jgi:hypothetical protein
MASVESPRAARLLLEDFRTRLPTRRIGAAITGNISR